MAGKIGDKIGRGVGREQSTIAEWEQCSVADGLV